MTIDYSKNPEGLVPAIVQDAQTRVVLMLGYMNADAVAKTQETKHVTFYSRSKQRLWTKGEESGHFLELVDMDVDCDNDTLLIKPIQMDQHATPEPIPVGTRKISLAMAFCLL